MKNKKLSPDQILTLHDYPLHNAHQESSHWKKKIFIKRGKKDTGYLNVWQIKNQNHYQKFDWAMALLLSGRLPKKMRKSIWQGRMKSRWSGWVVGRVLCSQCKRGSQKIKIGIKKFEPSTATMCGRAQEGGTEDSGIATDSAAISGILFPKQAAQLVWGFSAYPYWRGARSMSEGQKSSADRGEHRSASMSSRPQRGGPAERRSHAHQPISAKAYYKNPAIVSIVGSIFCGW